jgi:hypothetical protein
MLGPAVVARAFFAGQKDPQHARRSAVALGGGAFPEGEGLGGVQVAVQAIGVAGA